MFYQVNGGRIFFREYGEGSPVVLLHGYLVTSDVWHSLAQRISANFRVITIDLPGHGMSDSFGTIHTMEFMSEVIKELLDSLGIKEFFLTGHSLGGYVTLAFLELFRNSLTGYCLFHSQPFPDASETIEKRMMEIAFIKAGKKEMFIPGNINRMFATANLESFSEEVERIKEIASALNDDGIIAVLNGMMARPSRLSLMEEGRVPCLWILGEKDNYISCEAIRTRVKLPANAQVVILKSSGHMGFIEEENKSAEVITEFIENLRKR
jgi:pimeloyl-ACP methyl ester carboxylesterase